MPIITCPRCKVLLKPPEGFSADRQKLRCPKCSLVIDFPDLPPAEGLPPEAMDVILTSLTLDKSLPDSETLSQAVPACLDVEVIEPPAGHSSCPGHYGKATHAADRPAVPAMHSDVIIDLRGGLNLLYLGTCSALGAWGLLLLFSLFALACVAMRQREVASQFVFPLGLAGAGLLAVLALGQIVLGSICCLAAPAKHGAKTLAIVHMVLLGVALTFGSLGIYFWVTGLPEVSLLIIDIIALLQMADLFLFLFFLGAVAHNLHAASLAGNIQKLTIWVGTTLAIVLVILFAFAPALIEWITAYIYLSKVGFWDPRTASAIVTGLVIELVTLIWVTYLFDWYIDVIARVIEQLDRNINQYKRKRAWRLPTILLILDYVFAAIVVALLLSLPGPNTQGGSPTRPQQTRPWH